MPLCVNCAVQYSLVSAQ